MIKTTLINVAGTSDAMSALSGLDGMSMDSGPDSEFHFGDMQSKAHRKEKHEENAKDIDDIGEIGVGTQMDQKPNIPKPAATHDSRKQFSSYRKRLQQARGGAGASEDLGQHIKSQTPVIKEENCKEEEDVKSIEQDIAGINQELE